MKRFEIKLLCFFLHHDVIYLLIISLPRQNLRTTCIQRTKDGKFSDYAYIKDQLSRTYWISQEEILFAPKDDSKDHENIFRDSNEGKYRVSLASTGMLDFGCEHPKNLYALPPWMCHGNQLPLVFCHKLLEISTPRETIALPKVSLFTLLPKSDICIKQ